MSELADIMEAIRSVSHGGKIRGLSPIESRQVERAVEKANAGDPSDVRAGAPGWLRRIADYWQERVAGDRIATLEFENKALSIAARHSVDEIRGKIAKIEGSGASLAAHHAAGVERMGSGTRPTAAAVAGEGTAGTFDAVRPWVRALEIKEEAA